MAVLPLIAVLLFFTRYNIAQEKNNRIEGFVKDNNGNPLFGANVVLLSTKTGSSTDINGKFSIPLSGKKTFTLKISYIGYKSKFVKIKNYNFPIKILLDPKVFNLGGIEVVAEEELVPVSIATTTVIKSGEIEHLQATSIREVLELVPGIQKSKNLGLGRTSQVSIRSEESNQLSAFGTKVIIDGVAESNNANMQFERLTGSKFGINNMGGGIDLRTIPADNIEKVEVISGVPSVRYGDLTEGIIKITTKSGKKPHRVKVKNNPNTSEINFGGSFPAFSNILNYNLNIARSERDKRLDGDEYTRYTGQITMLFASENVKNKLKFSGQFITDEEEPKNDLLRTKNYNRSFSFGISNIRNIKLNRGNKLGIKTFIKFKRINSKKSRLIQSDLRVLPNGDTVSVYNGTKLNKGFEWNLGAKVEYESEKIFSGSVNNFLTGIQLNYEANTGEGIVFDTLFNPYGADSKARPRSFDDVPGFFSAALYAEDNITLSYPIDMKISTGLRLDMYQPETIGFSKNKKLFSAKHGIYLNPRLNMIFYLGKKSQIRFGIGKSSKSPAMSRIYPMPRILEWKNPVTRKTEHYRFSHNNKNLKATESVKYELSFDHKFFNKIGISVTGYYSKRYNGPLRKINPVFRKINDKYYYLGNYSLLYNGAEYLSRGIETRIKSIRLKEINTSLNITFSYSWNKNPGNGKSYKAYPDIKIGQVNNYEVEENIYFGMLYKSSGKWTDKILMNYNLSYKNETLGLWISLRGEHLIRKAYQYFDLVPVDLIKLTPTALQSRKFSESRRIKPAKWLFSFNVSKSLFTGAEVSFYVNNFLDDPATNRYLINPGTYAEEKRNPDIFYGIEFSMILNEVFR